MQNSLPPLSELPVLEEMIRLCAHLLVKNKVMGYTGIVACAPCKGCAQLCQPCHGLRDDGTRPLTTHLVCSVS